MKLSEELRKTARDIGEVIEEIEKESSPDTMLRSFRSRFRSKNKMKNAGGLTPAAPIKMKPPDVKTSKGPIVK